LPARAPSQKKRVSSLMPGAGRLIFGGPEGAAAAAGFTGLAGLNLKTRNNWAPTFSSALPSRCDQ